MKSKTSAARGGKIPAHSHSFRHHSSWSDHVTCSVCGWATGKAAVLSSSIVKDEQLSPELLLERRALAPVVKPDGVHWEKAAGKFDAWEVWHNGALYCSVSTSDQAGDIYKRLVNPRPVPAQPATLDQRVEATQGLCGAPVAVCEAGRAYWARLDDDENECTLDCGCELWRDGEGVCLKQCAAHQAVSSAPRRVDSKLFRDLAEFAEMVAASDAFDGTSREEYAKELAARVDASARLLVAPSGFALRPGEDVAISGGSVVLVDHQGRESGMCNVSRVVCGQIGRVPVPPVGLARIVAEVAAQESSEIARAHIALSEALEDEDGGNDEVRAAAVDLCDALNALQVRAGEALAGVAPLESAEWGHEVSALARVWLSDYVPDWAALSEKALAAAADDRVQSAIDLHYPGGVLAFLSSAPLSTVALNVESVESGEVAELYILGADGEVLGQVVEKFPDLDGARIYAAKRPAVRYLLEFWAAPVSGCRELLAKERL